MPAPRSTLDKVFPIVAIGASAGGLEAFSTLLAHLPETTGVAYVFLQHLDPSHHSALEEILSRTKIPVTQATDGIEVQRNHVYLIPPNSDMVIGDGILRLSPRTLTHDQHSPIDSRAYADAVIETAREAVLILDANLRVMVANPVFYNSFQVSAEETVNRSIFELGNRQWNIPALRTLLEKIVRQKTQVDDFEVARNFERIGERIMILNARRLSTKQSLIFLTIEDVTDHRNAKEALEKQAELLKQSEETLRRLSAYLMTLQDEERRRIARELHDSTGQKLAAAKLQLDSLVKSGNVKAYEKVIAEAAQWIDECFQEVRTLSQLLHPPLLDEAGLISATRWMVDGFSARAKIQVDLQVTGEFGRLPQPVELALFRVVQESLSNIRRHSGATNAQITLARNDGAVRLEISDNGKGIPPHLLARSGRINPVVGVGILGMRERLAQLGGNLEIDSGQTGTTVKVAVPIAAAATH
jgi:signal transduction histidine kinase